MLLRNVKKMNGMLCDVMIISYGVISHSFLKYTKAFKTNNYDMEYLDQYKSFVVSNVNEKIFASII